MTLVNTWIFIYGLILILGGLVGYVHGHSLPSLFYGTFFGLLTLACFFLMRNKKKVGGSITCLIALAMSILFAIRLMHTHKMMPAGLILVLSLATLFMLLATYSKWWK